MKEIATVLHVGELGMESFVTETYNWIIEQERKFMEEGIPFDDRKVKFLIQAVRMIEPQLRTNHPDKQLMEKFTSKLELKFYKEPFDKRYMLFDFVKNFIHEYLIKKGIE